MTSIGRPVKLLQSSKYTQLFTIYGEMIQLVATFVNILLTFFVNQKLRLGKLLEQSRGGGGQSGQFQLM
jgi:polyhydroxyalkanoate synthesis regulator protein